ncbi:SIR2 family protein [Methanosarcina sp. 1.H.A.2.2]|uniref:SIR2 family protein n=1 Tax=Methanosarcina sp. 1.H.A.2.2 TaxID=1483601 RepID=UPI00062291BB|nr:SIR2 family protein [Methanosarcina sp. 1.H.A.2.2]KKH45720.1 hypothetical protein EO93_02310 [Methanosarcina sp. 1.H.A.2.2]
MDINSDEKILLLGAGFSKNFGAPLANEMWYLIFNHKEIQVHSRIRELMLNNFDYEFIYDSVLEGFADKEGLFGKKCSFIKFTDEEKDTIRKATNFAYEHIDKVFTQFMNYLEESEQEQTRQKEILTGVSQFISLFQQVYDYMTTDGECYCFANGDKLKVRSGKNSFIFTLNQDSFFEKGYHKICAEMDYQKICIPGIKEEQDGSDLVKLPSKEELYDNDILAKENFFLIKLHGSYNWVGSDGKEAMVIGKHKEDQISKEPLLSHYFEIFKKVLSQKQRRLLIIGYGFGDDHINHVISNAVENHGLKIYILSPGSIEKLKQRLSENYEDFINIYNGISGYFPYTEILTGDPVLDKPIREYFNNVFFDSNE